MALEPGTRVVDGHVMYSAAWLDADDPPIHADQRDLIQALPIDRQAAIWLTGPELVQFHHWLGEQPYRRGAIDERVYHMTADAIRGLLAIADKEREG